MSDVFSLICFDVSDHRKRYRLVKLLKGHGVRVQKSVFECLLAVERLQVLLEKCTRIIDNRTDSVRAYRLCANCQEHIDCRGNSKPPLDDGPVIS